MLQLFCLGFFFYFCLLGPLFSPCWSELTSPVPSLSWCDSVMLCIVQACLILGEPLPSQVLVLRAGATLPQLATFYFGLRPAPPVWNNFFFIQPLLFGRHLWVVSSCFVLLLWKVHLFGQWCISLLLYFSYLMEWQTNIWVSKFYRYDWVSTKKIWVPLVMCTSANFLRPPEYAIRHLSFKDVMCKKSI